MKIQGRRWRRLWCAAAPVAGCFLPLVEMVLCIVSAVILILTDRQSVKQAMAMPGAVLFQVFAGFTALCAVLYGNGLGLAVSFAAAALFLWFCWLRSEMNVRLAEGLCAIMALGSVISALATRVDLQSPLSYAVIERFSQLLDRPYEFSLEASARSCSTFFHPNYYGYVLAVICLVCLWQLIVNLYRCRQVRRRLALAGGYFIILILNGLMLPAPQSRTLVVALAAGVAALLLAWHWIFLPLAAVPGAILAGVNARRLLQMIPRIGSFLEGLNDRQEIWVAAWSQIRHHPWCGQGFYTYMQTWNQWSKKYTVHAHNLMLEMLLSFGIIGSLLLVGAMACSVKEGAAAWLKGKTRWMPLVLGVLVMTLIHGLTDVVLLSPQTFVLFAAVLSFSALQADAEIVSGRRKEA